MTREDQAAEDHRALFLSQEAERQRKADVADKAAAAEAARLAALQAPPPVAPAQPGLALEAPPPTIVADVAPVHVRRRSE